MLLSRLHLLVLIFAHSSNLALNFVDSCRARFGLGEHSYLKQGFNLNLARYWSCSLEVMHKLWWQGVQSRLQCPRCWGDVNENSIKIMHGCPKVLNCLPIIFYPHWQALLWWCWNLRFFRTTTFILAMLFAFLVVANNCFSLCKNCIHILLQLWVQILIASNQGQVADRSRIAMSLTDSDSDSK